MSASPALLFALTLTLDVPLEGSQAAELVAACSRAMQEESCSLAEAGTSPAEETLRATVRSAGEDQADVIVRLGQQELSSHLQFAEEDEPLERARAIGLAAGVLGESLRAAAAQSDTSAIAEEGTEPERPPEPQPREPEPQEREPQEPEPKEREPREPAQEPVPQPDVTPPTIVPQDDQLAAFLALQGGAGFDPGTELFDLGGAAQGGIRLWDSVFVTVGAHFFSAPEQSLPFRTLRLGPTAGLGYWLHWDRLHVVPLLQGGAELYTAQSLAPPVAEGSHWSPMIRTACLFGYPLGDVAWLHVAPEVDWILSPTTVFMGERPLTTGAPARLTFNVGVSFVSWGSR